MKTEREKIPKNTQCVYDLIYIYIYLKRKFLKRDQIRSVSSNLQGYTPTDVKLKEPIA